MEPYVELVTTDIDGETASGGDDRDCRESGSGRPHAVSGVKDRTQGGEEGDPNEAAEAAEEGSVAHQHGEGAAVRRIPSLYIQCGVQKACRPEKASVTPNVHTSQDD